MNDSKYLTVSALNKYIKYKFDNDEHLKLVFLKGEISNLKQHTTGHMYFSIKDETSKINAIMFETSARKLNFKPVDGTKVLVVGRISVYEATGNYQIYIDEMLEDGIGSLFAAFEKLKEKLSKEGLFDKEHKKAIPKMPLRIGIVTASTGAAVKDIISTVKRRFPPATTILFPSLVQGPGAAEDIVKNIKKAHEYELDVLIIGRGGGSIEDLWPFNEEIVARAIYESKIPTISAVGHEIDYTIADFVADMRAPTPTGAAEMAVPNIVDLLKHINQLSIRLNEGVFKKINYQKLYLDSIKGSFVLKNPTIMFESKKQKLDTLLDNLEKNMEHRLEVNNILLNNIIDNLRMLNPIEVLKRGYSIVSKNNVSIKNVNNLSIKDKVDIRLSNGSLTATIDEIMEENNERS